MLVVGVAGFEPATPSSRTGHSTTVLGTATALTPLATASSFPWASLYGSLGSGDCSSHLGQRQLTPELLQMRGHDRPSEGLRPPCGVSSLTLSLIATAASTQPNDALIRFGVVRHDKAGVLLFDCPRRREAAGEHATQFATISSENKAAVYEHFFLRVSKKSRFYRTK